MRTTGMDKRIWASVNEDGKSAAAGMWKAVERNSEASLTSPET